MNASVKKWLVPALFCLAGAVLGLMSSLILQAQTNIGDTLFTPVSFMLSMGLAGWLLSDGFSKGGEKNA